MGVDVYETGADQMPLTVYPGCLAAGDAYIIRAAFLIQNLCYSVTLNQDVRSSD